MIDDFCREDFFIDIDFYNTEHEDLLGKHPYPEGQILKMKETVQLPLKISTVDFLTYYLFHNKKHNSSMFPNKLEISKKIHIAFYNLSVSFELRNGSLRGLLEADGASNDVVEHIGDAIGMIVIGELHGLINADWEVIPVFSKKAFDFQISSTGQYFVQVETKGSFVENNANKPTAINNHKVSILEKKNEIQLAGSDYPFPANVMYGTIASVDSNPTHNLKCWLLDPVAENIEISPKIYKYMARMAFSLKFAHLISPESQLTFSLAERFKELESSTNPEEIMNLPLLKRDRKEFSYYKSNIPDFFYKKTMIKVMENTNLKYIGGGAWFYISDEIVLFVGVTIDLIKMIPRQSLDEITSFKNDERYLEGEWMLNASETANDKNELSKFSMKPKLKLSQKNLLQFSVTGTIGISSSSVMIGVLKVKSD